MVTLKKETDQGSILGGGETKTGISLPFQSNSKAVNSPFQLMFIRLIVHTQQVIVDKSLINIYLY